MVQKRASKHSHHYLFTQLKIYARFSYTHHLHSKPSFPYTHPLPLFHSLPQTFHLNSTFSVIKIINHKSHLYIMLTEIALSLLVLCCLFSRGILQELCVTFISWQLHISHHRSSNKACLYR